MHREHDSGLREFQSAEIELRIPHGQEDGRHKRVAFQGELTKAYLLVRCPESLADKDDADNTQFRRRWQEHCSHLHLEVSLLTAASAEDAKSNEKDHHARDHHARDHHASSRGGDNVLQKVPTIGRSSSSADAEKVVLQGRATVAAIHQTPGCPMPDWVVEEQVDFAYCFDISMTVDALHLNRDLRLVVKIAASAYAFSGAKIHEQILADSCPPQKTPPRPDGSSSQHPPGPSGERTISEDQQERVSCLTEQLAGGHTLSVASLDKPERSTLLRKLHWLSRSAPARVAPRQVTENVQIEQPLVITSESRSLPDGVTCVSINVENSNRVHQARPPPPSSSSPFPSLICQTF
jgi:hypothetical protein